MNISPEETEILKQEIKKGISSLDAGQGLEMTNLLFTSIKERGRQRLAKETEKETLLAARHGQ